jgi:hypothetical protein
MSPEARHRTAVVLLHHPVTNRQGVLGTTAVTNMDIHDLSRTCRTYEIDRFFLVSPLEEQGKWVDRILGYWQGGVAREWHPDRAEALARTRFVLDFDAALHELVSSFPGRAVEVVMPDARPLQNQVGYDQTRREWAAEPPGIKVIVLGTGWGVAPGFYPRVHRFLGPVYGPRGDQGYNHLSVRAAGAVILDRLFGLP